MVTTSYWEIEQIMIPRGVLKMGMPRAGGGMTPVRQIWECKDGYLAGFYAGGILKAMSLGAVVLTEWMTEEGMAEDMTEVDWLNQDMQTVEPEVVQHQQDVAQKFLMTKTKAELYDRCVRDKIPFAPISDPRDIATNRQLEARNFFVQIEHPELGDPLTYCGPFVQFSESPMKRWFQAPRIGEHNSEIYEKELGLSSEQMVMLKRARAI